MVQRVTTVAFEGIEVRPVDVQVQVAPGMPAFAIVGLPDKAVSEARERVRSALIASGRSRPAASPSIWPRPTCPRKAATTICRSRSA
jgi:magnesium chelatase family protein